MPPTKPPVIAVAQATAAAAPPRKMLTPTQAAHYAGISPRTLRRYITEGRLIGYRLGPRVIRIDLADLDALLARLES
jgi:excisionase family DNA binding protein